MRKLLCDFSEQKVKPGAVAALGFDIYFFSAGEH